MVTNNDVHTIISILFVAGAAYFTQFIYWCYIANRKNISIRTWTSLSVILFPIDYMVFINRKHQYIKWVIESAPSNTMEDLEATNIKHVEAHTNEYVQALGFLYLRDIL